VEYVDEYITFYYNKGGIFTEFVSNFMNMRTKAMQDGISEMEKFCKMIMSSASENIFSVQNYSVRLHSKIKVKH
jgi:hypothetical protein